MAKKDDLLRLSESETIIGSGVRVKGTLASDGDVTIDGMLAGEVKTLGNLVLGVNAHVKANVTARNVTIAGQLNGNIKTEGEATITETGKVNGNISCGSLAIAGGAVFIGASVMTENTPREMADEEAPELDAPSGTKP